LRALQAIAAGDNPAPPPGDPYPYPYPKQRKIVASTIQSQAQAPSPPKSQKQKQKQKTQKKQSQHNVAARKVFMGHAVMRRGKRIDAAMGLLNEFIDTLEAAVPGTDACRVCVNFSSSFSSSSLLFLLLLLLLSWP
jgi:hypothetical protein